MLENLAVDRKNTFFSIARLQYALNPNSVVASFLFREWFRDQMLAKKIPLRTASGFTLIELMVTLSILAILLGVAMPSFTSFIDSNRLTGQINELVGDLSHARSEAGARSRTVRLCIAASATTCATSGTDWALGRILWVDSNGNDSLDASTELVKYVPALVGSVTLIAAGFPTTHAIIFLPTGGLLASSSGTFTLCASGNATGRQITIPSTGRPSTKTYTTCT